MSKVILLCGRIASGKTTYASALRRESGAVILSCDELMLTLFDQCLGEKHDETVARCSRYLNGVALQITASGLDAVLDFGYWSRKEREAVRAFFVAHQVPVSLHYVRCEEALRLKRLRERNRMLAHADHRVYLIGDELRERLDQKFEEPSEEEIDLIVETDHFPAPETGKEERLF